MFYIFLILIYFFEDIISLIILFHLILIIYLVFFNFYQFFNFLFVFTIHLEN
jgi:hypothetical protein